MPTASGVVAQVGYAPETTWGSFQTPTRFLEVVSEGMNLTSERIESAGIRTGSRVLRSDRWIANKKGVSGSVGHEVSSKGFGLLFKHSLGAVTIATAPGGTNAKRHRCIIGDPFGLGLTVQVGRPDNAGVVQPFSYLGCKVVSWSLHNDVDGLLMLDLTLDGSDETTSQALASASFAASDELLHYAGGAVTVGGSQVATVKSIAINGANALKTDRYGIRSSTLKKEPIANNLVEITGTITSEFESLTAYNRFANGTMAAVVATWTGFTALEAAIMPSVSVNMPNCRFDGDTPNLSGRDMLELTQPFKALYDGSLETITLDYISLDTVS